MPIIKSAEKKLRQAKTHAQRNRKVRDDLRTQISSFRKRPSKKDLPGLMSRLGRAAKKGVIHKNKASRLFSRLSALLVNKK